MKDIITKIIGCTLILLGMLFLQGMFEGQDNISWKDILIVIPISIITILVGAGILVWNFKRYPLKEEDY